MQSRDTDTATLIPKLVPQPASKSLPTLLIVEDDENIRTQMKWALTQDYQVLFAGDRPQALALLRKEQPALVTLDLGLPPHPGQVTEGMAALAEMVESDPLLKIIIITGQAEKEHALQAVDQGAVILLPSAMTTARLRRFSSSRTLPGQSWVSRLRRASLVKPVTFFLFSAAYFWSRAWARSLISPSRSWRRGRLRTTTPMR